MIEYAKVGHHDSRSVKHQMYIAAAELRGTEA